MKILDLISTQWAMIPEKISGILEIIGAHNQGEKLDLKAIENTLLSIDLEEKEESLIETNETVAVIPIQGVLMKRPSAFERILLDAEGTEKIQRDIEKAIQDPYIKTIVLYIDSPGGTVDGTKELADYIYNARDKKKIIAFSDGMIASAAYWIASAASEIYISSETVNVGSIGVITTHVDFSAYNEGRGVKITDIYSGEFKAAGSENKPLDDKSKAYIQDRVDYLYAVFVNDVARNRKQSTAFVLDRMAGGRVYIGGNAIKNNLVDGVSTYKNLMEDLSTMKNMDEFKAHEFYGQAKAEIEKEISAKFEAEKKDIEIKALESERKRISDIQALSLPGFEKVIESGILKGLSASEVSIEIIKAQKESLKIKAENFEKDGPETVPEIAPIENEPKEEKAFLDLIREHATENKISVSEARAAVIKQHPAAYQKYLKGDK